MSPQGELCHLDASRAHRVLVLPCRSDDSCSSLASTSGSQAVQQRGMSYAYARKPEGKSWVHHENRATFAATQLVDYLIKTVPKFVTMATNGPAQSSVLYQEATIYTKPEHLVPLSYFLRDHVNLQFKCLVDITAVDFPERAARFEVVYHLLSPRHNNRIRIKVRRAAGPPPRSTPAHPAAREKRHGLRAQQAHSGRSLISCA